MGPLCPLPSCGPLWSIPLTLYLCKALCQSFLGWAGWAGRGWGRLSPLSLVGQEVLSLSPWLGGWETFRVSTSGLVNIYIVSFCFLTMWRGRWIPTAKQVPSEL